MSFFTWPLEVAWLENVPVGRYKLPYKPTMGSFFARGQSQVSMTMIYTYSSNKLKKKTMFGVKIIHFLLLIVGYNFGTHMVWIVISHKHLCIALIIMNITIYWVQIVNVSPNSLRHDIMAQELRSYHIMRSKVIWLIILSTACQMKPYSPCSVWIIVDCVSSCAVARDNKLYCVLYFVFLQMSVD